MTARRWWRSCRWAAQPQAFQGCAEGRSWQRLGLIKSYLLSFLVHCIQCFCRFVSICPQAFAEGQKQQLSEARAEIEDAQRRGREGQARLRGLEEQLLAAQDACGKANSQVRGRTGGAAW